MGYFDKFKNEGVPFMEGKTKGELQDVLNQKLHIDEFGFINGENGRFAVIHVKEYPEQFFFCNSVITEMLETVKEDGQEALLATSAITFSKAVSKKNREYYTFEVEEAAQESVPF